MSKESTAVETVEITAAAPRLDDVVDLVQRSGTRVHVEKDGTLIAAVVSSDDLRRLDQFDADRAERFKIIDEIREAFKDVLPQELEREAERALVQVRAEMQSEREHPVPSTR